MHRFSNLKSRLMLLVLIGLLPVVLLILYSDIRYRHSVETDVRNNLSSFNFLTKDNLNKFFDTTRLLLITLSQTAEVQKGSYASISVFFRNLHKHYPDYVNIGMADLKGNIVSSALPMKKPVNSADLGWFQQALRTRDFSIGEYQFGRIAGQPVLVLSRPVFDEKGRMKAVLTLSIKLDWLKRLVTDVKLPEGYASVITDRKGTILSRHPEPDKWIGKFIPEAQLINAMLSQKNGIAEIAGLDGVKRIQSFSTAGYGENYIYIAIGMSKKAAFKEINQILLIDLLLLIAVGGAGFVIARLFSNAVILRPVNALKHAAENLSRGNFSARTGYTDRTDELGRLAGIFDYMADAVEKEISMRKKAEEELRKYRDHLEELVKERTKELHETQEALLNILEDVNEKSRELAQANVKITELDRLKSVFLATMSHELRTPLNSIIGFTGIVLQGMSGPLNDEQVKQLTMVKGSANHLLALINDVLDISKIEAGQVQITRRSFDMRSVIEAALRTVLPLAAKKGLSLDSVIASDVGVMISDQRRVEQILINLVNNAVKFTEQGKIRVSAKRSIGVSATIVANRSEGGVISAPHGGFVEISVADTGIGIKAEDMGKLFTPFSQIDTGLARNHEGTGLGLSICGKLVEMLEGTIRVESEWGKGSTFTFTLPL